MKLTNYIPISRKLFEHQLWCEQRSFSKFEAWLDLLQSARFENGKLLIGCKWVEVKRGQLAASLRYLAQRWNWSVKKVSNFLQLLINDRMITKETHPATGQTLITICNYDNYNAVAEQKQHKREQSGNTGETTGQHNGYENNKENKEKKEKKIFETPKNIETNVNNNSAEKEKSCAKKETARRRLEFYNQLAQYRREYGEEMLGAFYNYWSELDKTKTVMRWEMQQTWELETRLAYWANNGKRAAGNTAPAVKTSKISQNAGMLKEILNDIKEGRI